MDNREAVNWLINISADIGKVEHSDLWHYERALTEIKDMLESIQPVATDTNVGNNSEITNSSDAVSRQAAIDIVVFECGKWTGLAKEISKQLKQLPPAQPEHKARFADKDHVWIDGKQYISLPRFQEAVKEAQPKEGHWIGKYPTTHICSECGWLIPDSKVKVFAYCPNCGARMVKGERQK